MPLTSSSARCTSLVARTAASTEGNSLPPREKTTTHDGDQAYSAHGRGACCVILVARSALRVACCVLCAVCCVLCAVCYVLCAVLWVVVCCGLRVAQHAVSRTEDWCLLLSNRLHNLCLLASAVRHQYWAHVSMPAFTKGQTVGIRGNRRPSAVTSAHGVGATIPRPRRDQLNS